MEVSFYLKRPEALEPTAIFARISYNGLSLKYYPSEKINPKYWNKETQKARQSFTGYANFNRKLTDIANSIEDTIREYQNKNGGKVPPTDKLRNLLDLKLKDNQTKKVANTFLTLFDKIISDSEQGIRIHPKTGKPIAPNTIKTYNTARKHLQEFQQGRKRKIDFDTIDLDFYNDYTEYLIKTLKLSTNTIGKHIQAIKLVMNEATERGLNHNLAYKSKRFITVNEKVDSIYLNEKELTDLMKIDLSKQPKLERVRDLFLIGCYTGLRFSDFSILRPEQIKDGFIETTQVKTSEPVVIPIHERVQIILNKYNGVLPSAISNQKTNEYLKEVAAKLPALNQFEKITYTKGGIKTIKNTEKWKLVSTHTARRSFATNEYKAGTPTITIMAITGHKTEKAFLKYIKATPKEHAQLLKLAWENRQHSKIIPLTA